MAAPAITSIYGSTGRQSFLTPIPSTTWVEPDVTLPATASVSTVTLTQANRWSDVTIRTIVVTQNSGATVTPGAYYGVGFAGTAVDFTDDDGSIIELDLGLISMGALDTIANNGLSAILATQNGGWQHFGIGGNDLNIEDSITEIRGGSQQGQALILAPGGDPSHLISQNSFDETNVNYVGLFFRYAGSTTSGTTTFSFLQSVAHATYKIIEGEVSNPARLKVISDLEINTANLGTASFVRAGQSQYVSYRSISIGDGSTLVYFVESFSLEFAPDNVSTKSALFQVPDGYLKFRINLTDTSTCNIAGARISSGRGLTFIIDRIGSATTNFDRLILNGGGGRGPVTLDSNYSQSLGLYQSLGTVTLNGASLNGVTCTDVERIDLTASDTFNCNYQNASATSDGVVITGAPGTYTYEIQFSNNSGTADLTINPSSAGTFTFSNISVTSGYTLKVRNASATHAITVAIPAGITSSTSTAGGTITVEQPQPTLTISGIPAGGIFTIWDDEDGATDPQDLGTALQTTNPTDGNDIEYVGTGGNAVIFQFVPSTGDSANYQEFNIPGTIPTTSQTIDFSSNLELEEFL